MSWVVRVEKPYYEKKDKLAAGGRLRGDGESAAAPGLSERPGH
jgi:hypothetical protein